jgi:hypothetical protein
VSPESRDTVSIRTYSIGHKKSDTTKNVQFFSPSNKKPQATQQKPKLKQKKCFFGGQIAYQNYRKSVKKVSFEKKHGLMLLVKKNHQKTVRGLN